MNYPLNHALASLASKRQHSVIAQFRALLAIMEPDVRRKLGWAMLGSVAVAAAEVVGVASVLPLMQLLTGTAIADSPFLSRLASAVGTTDPSSLTIYVALIVFVAFLVKGLLAIGFRWWMLGFLYRQEAQTSTALLRYYLDAPYALHLQRHSGEFLRVMNESVAHAYSLVVISLVGAIADALSIAFILGTLFVLEPWSTLGTLAYFSAATLAYLWLIRGRAQRYGVAMNESGLQIHKSGMAALGGIKEIKVRHNGAYFLREYLAARQVHAASRRKAAFISEVPKFVLELLFIVGVGVLAVAIFSTEAPAGALSLLALFVAAGFRALPSLVRLLASLNAARVGQDSMRIVVDEMTARQEFYATSEPSALDGAASARPAAAPLRLERAITAHNLHFRYPDADRDVIAGLNFEIPAGSSVALVGSSGAGKSTLVDLLLGLHQPTSGEICVDGVPISSQLAAWQSSIGMVPQDVYLLDDSLRANIVFGAEAVSEAALAEAVRRAELDELVHQTPAGLASQTGERGVRLSGGQRQRIGIARALYYRPQVLFLDEATSSLDNETERKISQTIAQLHGQMTIIIVAHRLSTVKNCDQILFLSDGQLAARGTFAEVTAANAEFAQLARLGSLDRS